MDLFVSLRLVLFMDNEEIHCDGSSEEGDEDGVDLGGAVAYESVGAVVIDPDENNESPDEEEAYATLGPAANEAGQADAADEWSDFESAAPAPDPETERVTNRLLSRMAIDHQRTAIAGEIESESRSMHVPPVHAMHQTPIGAPVASFATKLTLAEKVKGRTWADKPLDAGTKARRSIAPGGQSSCFIFFSRAIWRSFFFLSFFLPSFLSFFLACGTFNVTGQPWTSQDAILSAMRGIKPPPAPGAEKPDNGGSGGGGGGGGAKSVPSAAATPPAAGASAAWVASFDFSRSDAPQVGRPLASGCMPSWSWAGTSLP